MWLTVVIKTIWEIIHKIFSRNNPQNHKTSSLLVTNILIIQIIFG